MRLAELTAPEAAARLAAGASVLLPMGSLETHGPAAPMGDFLLAEAIALRIAEAASALVAPVIPFGGEDFFHGVPGAVALSTPTLTALLRETLLALHGAGARRLVVVNGHGGNLPAIEAATRSIRRQTGRIVPALHLWRSAGAEHAALGGHPDSLGHGGDPVLSVALHLFPALCRTPAPGAPPGRLAGLPVTGFGTLGVAGAEVTAPTDLAEVALGGVQARDPARASAAHGERIVTRLVAIGVELLDRLEPHR